MLYGKILYIVGKKTIEFKSAYFYLCADVDVFCLDVGFGLLLMTKNIKIQWPNALVMILRLCSWHRHTPNLDKVTKIHSNCLIKIWF